MHYLLAWLLTMRAVTLVSTNVYHNHHNHHNYQHHLWWVSTVTPTSNNDYHHIIIIIPITIILNIKVSTVTRGSISNGNSVAGPFQSRPGGFFCKGSARFLPGKSNIIIINNYSIFKRRHHHFNFSNRKVLDSWSCTSQDKDEWYCLVYKRILQ